MTLIHENDEIGGCVSLLNNIDPFFDFLDQVIYDWPEGKATTRKKQSYQTQPALASRW